MRHISGHIRDLPRHLLALLLMAGTLAGTIYTMSAGHLTLGRSLEELVSVGGVGLALEWGGIFTGLNIQKLTLRIQATRRRDIRDALMRQRKELYRWFYAVVAISVLSNFLYRLRELDNFPLAAFVSAAPAVLIVLFTIKLQPLPPDYEAEGREKAQLALARVVEATGDGLVRHMGRLGAGEVLTPDDLRQVQFALSVVGLYADRAEAQGLAQAAQFGAPQLVDSSSIVYWTARDVVEQYDVALRTAQLWVRDCPGSRIRTGSTAREAPREAIERAHPPMLRLTAGPQNDATGPQIDAIGA